MKVIMMIYLNQSTALLYQTDRILNEEVRIGLLIHF